MHTGIAQMGWIIADAVTDAINWVGEQINNGIGYLAELIGSVFLTSIAGVFYGLQMGFFVIMDIIQLLFRKVAGLDTYYYQGQAQTGDMAMDFIFNPTVLSVFWSVLAVAVILLFATTFVAIIRSEVTEKGSNPKAPIIGRALKSIAYFAMVPVVSVLGIFFANVLLRMLDRATAVNNASTLSSMVFQAAAAQACRAENSTTRAKDFAQDFGIAYTTNYDVADAVLKGFANGTEINIVSNPNDWTTKPYMFTIQITGGCAEGVTTCNINNFQMVYYYFDLTPGFGFDYLIGFIGGFIACSMLLTAILGCMQRLFEITILFVISPPIIALMPIDNGSKYNQWRQEFIKRVIACYGPIIGLNLMFMILAIIGDYSLFPDEAGYAIHNALVKMFFMIVALTSLKDFTSLITSMFGGSDVSAMGEGKKEATNKMAGQILGAGQRLGKGAWNTVVGKAKRDEDGKLLRDDNGKVIRERNVGFGKAKDGLAGFKKDAKLYGAGGAIGGLLNKKDGLISDMMDISGVGKSLKDKAVGENPNSIGAVLLGEGNKARVKAASDEKAASDAKKAKEADLATEMDYKTGGRQKEIEHELAALNKEKSSGGVLAGSERESQINERMAQLQKQKDILENGGTSDAFGVATNVQDIEQLAGRIAEKLENLKVTIANPGDIGKDGKGGTGGSGNGAGGDVSSALMEAASALNRAAVPLQAAVRLTGENMGKAATELKDAARNLKSIKFTGEKDPLA